MDYNKDKINVLVKFLNNKGVGDNEIIPADVIPDEFDDNVFSVVIDRENYKYLILTDEEADKEYKAYMEEEVFNKDIDWYSYFSFNTLEYIINNFVDKDSFYYDMEDVDMDFVVDQPENYVEFFDMYEVKKAVAEAFVNENNSYHDEVVNLFEEDLIRWDSDYDGIVDETYFIKFLNSFYNDKILISKLKYDFEPLDDFYFDVVQNLHAYYEDDIYAYISQYRTDLDTDEISELLLQYLDVDSAIDYIKFVEGRGILANYDDIENTVKYNGIYWYLYRLE